LASNPHPEPKAYASVDKLSDNSFADFAIITLILPS
jgi:hypothetical protein